MSKYKKQSHVVWKCDYHIVWTPKYRFRVLSGLVKELVEHDVRLLAEWKGCEVIELNVQPDHIHLVVSIPPKVSVSELMAVRRCGTLKGKLAIKLFKSYPQLKKKPYWGNHFWARGYFVNTVGINEEHIRRYVKYQEAEDRKEESHNTGFDLFDPPS
jgi:putative transposase